MIRIEASSRSDTWAALLLLAIAVGSYGLLLPKLGLYWDDLPITWIKFQLGTEALTRYFSTNRPAWGLLHQFTTSYLQPEPIYWQVFALLLRWITAYLLYKLVQNIERPVAFGASALFLIYPGFNGHWVSYVFSHFYIVIALFLLSLLLMLYKGWWWTAVAFLCSALNLWMMEYFFFLEFVRPVIIWFVLSRKDLDWYSRSRNLLSIWSPYLSLFIIAILSRLYVHNNQTYQLRLLENGDSGLWSGMVSFAKVSLHNIWTAFIKGWWQVFEFNDLNNENIPVRIVYVVVVAVCSFIVFKYLTYEAVDVCPSKPAGIIFLGLFALVLAGIPFWLTNIQVRLTFPASRTTLPFMLGSSLVLMGLFHYLPSRIKILSLSLLIGLAAGKQFAWSATFQRDWEFQRDLFWQMSWRAPSLHPNTTILLNDRALYFDRKDGDVNLIGKDVFRYVADNSLAAVLNWTYDPDQSSQEIAYVLFYPRSRLGGSLPGLDIDIPITYNYLAGVFQGNTSRVVGFYYAPPGCLRLLDPEIDTDNHLIPTETLLREAAHLSSSRWVGTQSIARPPSMYGPEPEPSWCFYFEKADLARQQGSWAEVVELGNTAFSLGYSAQAPMELFTFIEGYAHTNNWEQALQLSRDVYQRSPNYVGPLLCRLWDRIEAKTIVSSERDSVLITFNNEFSCQ